MRLKVSSVAWYPGKPHRSLCGKAKARKAASMRTKPTDSEALLWDVLRDKRCRGLRFRRQSVMFGYILDFFCPSIGLAVEVDGSSHDARAEYDEKRDSILANRGVSTLRLDIEDVLRGNARSLILEAADQLPY